MTGDPNQLGRLAEALPLKEAYEDAIQPAAKELGRGLETVALSINAALLPLRAFIWGMDRIERWLIPSLAERLRTVPQDDIVTPNPLVVGPAIEALRFAAGEETIREMYANLIASSMERATAYKAHPAFVEILKQLSPDEARIMGLFTTQTVFPTVTVWADIEPGNGIDVLRNFSALPFTAGCEHPELGANYLDNICRLGLAIMDDGHQVTVPNPYQWLRTHAVVRDAESAANSLPGRRAVVTEGMLKVTKLGEQFVEACVTKSPPSTA
jgi:hypothetical protein